MASGSVRSLSLELFLGGVRLVVGEDEQRLVGQGRQCTLDLAGGGLPPGLTGLRRRAVLPFRVPFFCDPLFFLAWPVRDNPVLRLLNSSDA